MTLTDAQTADRRKPGHIKLHGPDGFAAMRKAGRLAAEALDSMVALVKPGITTEAIDKAVFEFAMDHGAYPATLQYRGYTKSCCTSINHVVCHGIPDDKPLREATSSTSTSRLSSTAGMAIRAACTAWARFRVGRTAGRGDL